MNRISVVGSSGAGKSTMAAALAEACSVPRIELDAIFHQPDWTPLPDEEFRDQVREVVSGDRWVVDGNYTSLGVNDIVWDAADTVIWMDFSRPVVISRVARRAVSRAATGQELWNGNTESWSNLVSWKPERNIVRWSWTRFDHTRDKYDAKVRDPRWTHLHVYRLRTPADAPRLLEFVSS